MGPTRPILMAFCHLHAKGLGWRRKRRGKLAWLKEKKGWRHSWWCKKD